MNRKFIMIAREGDRRAGTGREGEREREKGM
jgi:hypothetical protein